MTARVPAFAADVRSEPTGRLPHDVPGVHGPADPLEPQPKGDGLARGAKRPGRRVGGGTSPTARSLAKLRADGYTVAVVERWDAFAKIRRDLFGFVDVVALGKGETIAVQATSAANVAARVQKIADHENVAAVRAAGWRILVHGWAKRASGRWECREVDCS